MIFHFLTRWQIDAPLKDVWHVLTDSEQWPVRWTAVKKAQVVQLSRLPNGEGGKIFFSLKGYLPYTIACVTEIVRVALFTLLETNATGDVRGKSVWKLTEENEGTLVEYSWNVSLQKPLVSFFSPVLYPFLVHNHNVVMKNGEKGLKKMLENK